jgi:5-methylcytosine-specific restriction endonuclease McrA
MAAPDRRFTAERLGSAAWRELRLEILERDGWTCQVCGGPATQVDHVIPRVQGGASVPENLRAACAACNQAKSMADAGLAALAKRAAGNGGASICRFHMPARRDCPHSRDW